MEELDAAVRTAWRCLLEKERGRKGGRKRKRRRWKRSRRLRRGVDSSLIDSSGRLPSRTCPSTCGNGASSLAVGSCLGFLDPRPDDDGEVTNMEEVEKENDTDSDAKKRKEKDKEVEEEKEERLASDESEPRSVHLLINHALDTMEEELMEATRALLESAFNAFTDDPDGLLDDTDLHDCLSEEQKASPVPLIGLEMLLTSRTITLLCSVYGEH